MILQVIFMQLYEESFLNQFSDSSLLLYVTCSQNKSVVSHMTWLPPDMRGKFSNPLLFFLLFLSKLIFLELLTAAAEKSKKQDQWATWFWRGTELGSSVSCLVSVMASSCSSNETVFSILSSSFCKVEVVSTWTESSSLSFSSSSTLK